ncbi:DUF5615 family PIN-like protein [Mycobacterium heidelbergense]|uniref:DUF5615 family PIN-like protein n=1 Tax=Mycobacterium heidelbergense TaxID=53376 RepID=UPI001302021B|nr:DUF5615 family PIN-like protein [Mycobacterium heidelbergense]MCV7052056.1 DUF5615 family PIN-like protein [Mycobacterium heidelbergense]
MKFIVDAQLPDALVRHLVALGHDAVHVKQRPANGQMGQEVGNGRDGNGQSD